MNIASALKNKNRIAGEIAKLQKKIIANNLYIGDTKKFDTIVLTDNLNAERQKLVDLKVRIAKANVGIAQELVELAEAKAQLTYLTSLERYVGVAEVKGIAGYGEREKEVITYSQITAGVLDKALGEAQKLINDLQDKVDAFNATTSV